MPVKRRTLAKKPAFLAAYVRTASISKAAKAAKIERGLHYRWLADDPEYAASFASAQEEAAQILEDEAIRRAHEGVDEPLVYQGAFTYRKKMNKESGKLENFGQPLAVRKYSDSLLMFLLRGFRPDKYRDRGSMEVSGPNGAALTPPAIHINFVSAGRKDDGAGAN